MVRLLIPHGLAKREFDDDDVVRDEVIAAWRKKVFRVLPAKKVPGCRLLKAYVTTPRGPRRTLFLLQAASGETVFLMHRPKGDPVGDNMSYKNPAFVRAVDKAMTLALHDIEEGHFDVISREAELP